MNIPQEHIIDSTVNDALPSVVDIRRAAMDLLAYREHSQQELLSKLKQKLQRKFKLDEAIFHELLDVQITEQIHRLAEENLQSDERFVESFINGRRAQGKGPLRIRQELEQKNITSQLISTYLIEEDEQWLQLAIQVYQKKFGVTKPASYQEQAKRLRFMHYRGFPASLVRFLFDATI